MNDTFTVDLRNRLSEFVNNVSFETLSKAFDKSNFEGYRHLKGSFFGLTDGTFDAISVGKVGTISMKMDMHGFAQAVCFVPHQSLPLAADQQDLALAA